MGVRSICKTISAAMDAKTTLPPAEASLMPRPPFRGHVRAVLVRLASLRRQSPARGPAGPVRAELSAHAPLFDGPCIGA